MGEALTGRRGQIVWTAFFALLVLFTRLPWTPQQIFSFDDVNFAYAISDFNPRLSQPQMPGYPVFVLETRLMRRIGFKRAESNLMATSLLASAASVALLLLLGTRMFGFSAACAACLLLVFNPTFWYAGVTSAVRVHLAVVSVGVALLCYRMWQGEKHLALWTSLALGVGAGVRPELGLVLLPLWAVSTYRSGVDLKTAVASVAVLAASVMVWLVPTTWFSGGFATYFRLLLAYSQSEAGQLTSPLFGASLRTWLSVLSWLAAWLFTVPFLWPAPILLAWRRGWGFEPGQAQFLGIWFFPPLLFAALFHTGDPGHVQSMTPVVALVGGYLMSRASLLLAGESSPLRLVLTAKLSTVMVVVPLAVMRLQGRIWVGTFLAAALVLGVVWSLLVRWTPGGGRAPQWLFLTLLLEPALVLGIFLFFYEPWYYRAAHASLRELASEQFYAGLAMSSRTQVRETVELDDHVITTIRTLAAGGPSVVIWKEGLTTWRKIAFYEPALPILVDARNSEGKRLMQWIQGPKVSLKSGEIRLDPGTRIIWLVGKKYRPPPEGHPRFDLEPYVSHTDLPLQPGTLEFEGIHLRW